MTERVKIFVTGPKEDADLARRIVRDAMIAAGWPMNSGPALPPEPPTKPGLRVIRGGGGQQ